MLRKFLAGMAFGCGFSITAFVILYILIGLFLKPTDNSNSETDLNSDLESDKMTIAKYNSFNELSLEEQIATSSFIAMGKYEHAGNGKVKLVIKEFLKEDKKSTIYYSIGDEFKEHTVYTDEQNYGNNVVIFFTGSPAKMRMSIGYSGDRIMSLGDMPVELFKSKCKAPEGRK